LVPDEQDHPQEHHQHLIRHLRVLQKAGDHDQPTKLRNPALQTTDASFGVRTNCFGFNITGMTNIPIVVEAWSDLASGAWLPVKSLNLPNGSYYFSTG